MVGVQIGRIGLEATTQSSAARVVSISAYICMLDEITPWDDESDHWWSGMDTMVCKIRNITDRATSWLFKVFVYPSISVIEHFLKRASHRNLCRNKH